MNLQDSDFRRIASLVHEHAGISLSPAKQSMIEARLSKRLNATEERSFTSYLRRVQRDPKEFQVMLESLTTHRTAFFRESAHFEVLLKVLRSGAYPLSGTEGLRIWCAACSSGEEAYSLAMALLEGLGESLPFKILASDLSGRMLERARQGLYEEPPRSDLSPLLRDKYFLRDGKQWRAGDLLKRHLGFAQINLLEPPNFLKPWDMIFCRNAMIYFDSKSQARVVRGLEERLRPGAYLFTGLSESLLNVEHSLENIAPSVYLRRA